MEPCGLFGDDHRIVVLFIGVDLLGDHKEIVDGRIVLVHLNLLLAEDE